mmetsp:Transcript_8358/g.25051  ORF Transcript_8358/g.25051 Transcript_8358/m.25051 type:complete len:421 (+) Transcript_8358:407-1669(+)|eukprot:CAMPEP_0206137914 /NCGR_PEP_ID=MMETSP1473-20131121/2936_1 /ASSEMBLY_ACC=CAM_ASM_001109 /TAXON_ID=1461547 /ORGANISM="Stichococcus sp, Strain RCC1054" /LENGTH=420 /DNA_ID=CAMNT_0053531185 /DNA_START=406 /DNA_END=1668 /DNA_ORIENTATION=-
MIALWQFDILAAVILSATALGGAYLPVVLARNGKETGERSLSFVLGNMLSAGVMVSAGFCHLLGDAIEQLTKSFKYPLAPFLCACGFMSTLVADQIVEVVTAKPREFPVLGEGEMAMLSAVAVGGDASGHGGHGHGHSQGHCFGAAIQQIAAGGGASALGEGKGGAAAGGRTAHLRRGGSPRQRAAPRNGGGVHVLESDDDDDEHTPLSGSPVVGRSSKPQSGKRGGSLLSEQQLQQRSDAYGHSRGDDSEEEGGGGSSGATHSFEIEKPVRSQVSFLTAVLMGVALTFHSLLEGAALGAQPDVVNSLHIFIAIQAHKGLAAYALGSSIVDSEAGTRQFWSVIATFAFATPLGISLGFLLSSFTTSSGAAAISALASGTFLYVAFMEVLPRELNDGSHRLLKLGMLLLGFALMSLLAIWA